MKRNILKSFCLVLSLMLFVSAPLSVSVSGNSAIDDARRSVVRVFSQYPDGSAGIGTAFIVAQSGTSTILVTNLHVVSGASAVLIFPNDARGVWIEAQVTYMEDGLDLAILTTPVGLSGRPALPLAKANDVRAAETVYALGFPGLADELIRDGEYLPSGPDDVTITSGIVSRINVTMDNAHRTRAFQTDCYINKGNSGGPLLNENGAVIGVNTWGHWETEGVNYAITINYIITALNNFGIEYASEGDSAAETDAPPVTETETSATEAETEATETTTTTAAETTADADVSALVTTAAPSAGSGGGSTLLRDALVGAAIGAVVGFIAFLVKKKKPAPAEAAPAAAGTAVSPATAAEPVKSDIPKTQPVQTSSPPETVHLVCSGGVFAGNTFPVNGKVLIGRDPMHCQIVFPNDTKGISSRHCELNLVQGGVTLTDKGSTYGTFLSNGRRLNSNETVTLKAGEGFYLADNVNDFKVL